MKLSWMDESVKNVPVEFGAAWISREHFLMRKLMKDYKLYLFRQYGDGQ
jgi:hypothetical protein